MADEIRVFTIDVPAGTPSTAPTVVDCSFEPRIVTGIQVVVPPGPSGALGLQVRCSGVVVIPYLSDKWFITSGEIISWPVSNMPDSGSWQVAGYNTGSVEHSAYFRFLLNYIPVPGATRKALLDENQLAVGDVPLFDTGGVTTG